VLLLHELMIRFIMCPLYGKYEMNW